MVAAAKAGGVKTGAQQNNRPSNTPLKSVTGLEINISCPNFSFIAIRASFARANTGPGINRSNARISHQCTALAIAAMSDNQL